jgi:hypothetical protein
MIAKTEKIENLDLSVRAVNVLRELNIYSVEDLIDSDLDKIRHWRNVGRKTFIEIEDLLKKIGRPDLAPDTLAPSQPICNLVDTFLLKITQREREILVKRTGLSDEKEVTLESLGFNFGLTRERVRQIEEKIRLRLIKVIRRESKGILDAILRIIRDQQLLSTEEIANIYVDLAKENFKFPKDAMVNLIMQAIGNGVAFLQSSGNLWSVSKPIANRYPDIMRIARRILSGVTMDLASLAIEVSREIGFREKAEIELVEKTLRASNRFLNISNSQDNEPLSEISPKHQSLPGMRKDFAYFYIKRQGVPVNVREVFRAMQEEAPHLLPQGEGLSCSLHVLDANLERDRRLAWAGMSMFALVEWGYEHEVRTIDKAIERLLRRTGRPMTISEIRNYILNLYSVSPSSIPSALERERGKRFRRVKAGVWTLI